MRKTASRGRVWHGARDDREEQAEDEQQRAFAHSATNENEYWISGPGVGGARWAQVSHVLKK
jgi:hypothetical protein